MLKDGGGGYDGLMAEEMQRELDIMRSLSHDNVVQIKGILHDESNDSSKVIIIMEYVREGSLDRYLHNHKDSIKFPKQVKGT